MNQLGEFRGVCPLCYLPVKHDHDFREIQNADKKEVYHAPCLHDWVNKNTPEDADTLNIGFSLLEQHKQLILGFNSGKKEQWIASQMSEWQNNGMELRYIREYYGVTLTTVSKELGISNARLKRFEQGEPVRDAKLLYAAYFLYLKHKNAMDQITVYESLMAQLQNYKG